MLSGIFVTARTSALVPSSLDAPPHGVAHADSLPPSLNPLLGNASQPTGSLPQGVQLQDETSPSPFSPPPSPPPQGGSKDAWLDSSRPAGSKFVAVVVAGLGRTLNAQGFQNNFREAIARPLQPDVFIALSYDQDSSPQSIDFELVNFKRMLLDVSNGYLAWRRMARDEDHELIHDPQKEMTDPVRAAKIETMCPDGRNYLQFQFRTLKHVMDMMEEHETAMGYQYKVVVRARTDIVIEHILPPPEVLVKAVEPVQLIVSWAKKATNGKHLLDDQYAIMSRDIASQYFKTYELFHCGENNKDQSYERSWCSEARLGAGEKDAECFLGQSVHRAGDVCLSSFRRRFQTDWAQHMVVGCEEKDGSLQPSDALDHLCFGWCIRHKTGDSTYGTKPFEDGQEGKSITPRAMNATELLMMWEQDGDPCCHSDLEECEL